MSRNLRYYADPLCRLDRYVVSELQQKRPSGSLQLHGLAHHELRVFTANSKDRYWPAYRAIWQGGSNQVVRDGGLPDVKRT